MPTLEAHLNLAHHNQIVLDRLMATCEQNPDWVITVAFYMAVHLVEALFKYADTHDSCDHYERNTKLKNDYPEIWKPYAPLWISSCVARYLETFDPRSGQPIYYTSFAKFRSANSVRNLIAENLKKIEDRVNKLIAADETS